MKITTPKSITRALKNISLRTGIVLSAVVATFAIGAVALAYGPERPTYTIDKPADKVTFNSITNNPNYGDERNFSLVKDASNTSAGGWTDSVNVEDGKEYLVRIYVHNNAAANLNLVANNTRVMSNVPTTTGTNVKIDSYISADNATPQRVWDDVILKSDKRFNVAYVGGSARYNNNANPSTGFTLPDSIVTNGGALLGYEKMDGNIPGCFQYSGIATYKVKVQMEKTVTPSFTMDKKVRLSGTTEWKKSVTAKPGDKVDYQISYTNTGQVWQNNVVVRDSLPKNVAYQKGSTTLKNASNPDGNGMKVNSDDVVNEKGINIGNYAASSNAFVRFTAQVPSADKLEVCGTNTLRNSASVVTDNGNKNDTADVIVTKENCGPVQKECQPGIPEGDARCNVTPAVLPQTGPAELIGSIIAVAALAFGATYFLMSRKAYKKAMVGGHTDGSEVKLLTARTTTKPEDDDTTKWSHNKK